MGCVLFCLAFLLYSLVWAGTLAFVIPSPKGCWLLDFSALGNPTPWTVGPTGPSPRWVTAFLDLSQVLPAPIHIKAEQQTLLVTSYVPLCFQPWERPHPEAHTHIRSVAWLEFWPSLLQDPRSMWTRFPVHISLNDWKLLHLLKLKGLGKLSWTRVLHQDMWIPSTVKKYME